MAKSISRRQVGFCLGLIIASGCLCAEQPAFAKKGGGGGGKSAPIQAPTSRPQNPQAIAAQQRLTAAQHALGTATDVFKKKYEDNDHWRAAAKAQKAAQRALAREHDEVLDKLSGTDEYKAAVTKKEQATSDLEAAHADPTDADPQHTADLAAAVMDATQEKSRLEKDAVQNDSNYAAVHAKLDAADKDMSDLQDQEKAAMEQDPDWQKAHQNLVDAQSQYEKLAG